MKIVIVMAGFFPGQRYGGPPVSVFNFCSLMSEHECFIITSNHDLGSRLPYTSVPTGEWIAKEKYKILYLASKDYNKTLFEKEIKNIKPDLIYLQGLFQSCILPCLFLAKKYKIKVLLAPRGELCAGAFNKKYKKVPYIAALKILGLLRNVHFQSTSEEESDAIKKILGQPSNKIYSLSNVPSYEKDFSRQIVKKKGEAHLVFLSRIVKKKNLLFALKVLKQVQGNVFFDIYGPKENVEYWNECDNLIKSLPSNIHVKYCGPLQHDEVKPVLSRYDALLFPTFSENYGHVIAESLMVGTPVIISDQTPWNDVNAAKAGFAISLSLEKEFIQAVSCIINCDECSMRDYSQSAIRYVVEKQNIDDLKSKYELALKKIVNV